ncbi:MAG: hypothetical protein ACTSRA_20495 [Promethearchaeota archaeon]
MFFLRLIWFIVFNVAGIAIIYYRERIVRIFGKNNIAEKYLGLGGTYHMWVLIGMVCMIAGLFIILGKLSFLGI